MNFPLKDIELHIDDSYVEKAEHLIGKASVLDMQELEKHLWVFRIKDDQQYEVEIQISPSKVTASSCECKSFRKNKLCVHLVAALLTLRDHKKKLKEKKKRVQIQKRRVEQTSKLTVRKILENISNQDLKDFVRQYAKSNRNFSLAFKAQFAGIVPTADNLEKYNHLFDTTLSTASREGGKISVSGARQINHLTGQLLRHAEEAAMRKDYSEVAAIFKVVFDKSGLILSRMEKYKDELVALLKDFHRFFGNILGEEMAPDLKKQMWSHLLSRSANGAYKKNGLATSFIRELIPYSRELLASEALLEFIDQSLSESGLSEKEQLGFILARFRILEENESTTQAINYLNNHLGQPEVLKMVVEQSIKNKQLDLARQMANRGLDNPEFRDYHKQFRDYLLEIAVVQKKHSKVVQLARQQYLENFEDLYYEILKKQKNWKKLMPGLLEEMQRLPYSIRKRDSIAHLYIDNQQLDRLISYIRKIKSFDLLTKYDRILLRYDRDGTIDLYQYLLSDYLNNHLGRQSSQKIRQILEHLYASGETALAGQFVNLFRGRYPERHSLMEELEIFQ